MFIIIGIAFGILGAILAFINAYDGYSHFPEIPHRKKIRFSIEIAAGAFIMSLVACMFAYFLFRD